MCAFAGRAQDPLICPTLAAASFCGGRGIDEPVVFDQEPGLRARDGLLSERPGLGKQSWGAEGPEDAGFSPVNFSVAGGPEKGECPWGALCP